METTNASKYSCVDSKILGTLFALKSHAIVMEANIEVGYLSYWLVLLVEFTKGIYSIFGECFIPFDKFLFTRINFQLHLTRFEE